MSEGEIPEQLDDPRDRRRLPMIGLVLTAIYLAGLVLYLWVQGQNPAALQLNELGDFLGGVSSPLAFLWLVLGFFQQSREIRLSSKALHLQAREMRAGREKADASGKSGPLSPEEQQRAQQQGGKQGSAAS